MLNLINQVVKVEVNNKLNSMVFHMKPKYHLDDTTAPYSFIPTSLWLNHKIYRNKAVKVLRECGTEFKDLSDGLEKLHGLLQVI